MMAMAMHLAMVAMWQMSSAGSGIIVIPLFYS